MAHLKPPREVRPRKSKEPAPSPPLSEDEDDNRVVDERLRRDKRIPFDKVLKRYGYVRVER